MHNRTMYLLHLLVLLLLLHLLLVLGLLMSLHRLLGLKVTFLLGQFFSIVGQIYHRIRTVRSA